MAATSEVTAHPPRRLPGRKYDRFFFSGLTLLILVAVVVGFAPKYYLAGVFRAPLPSPLIHIHAVVFSGWILLLVVQTGLVSARRVALHRTLGLAGFGLAVLVPIFGFLAMASQLHFRAYRPNILTFSAVSFEGVFLFSIFAGLGYATRKRDLAAHKRYIMLATLGLLDAALFRLPVPFLSSQLPHDLLAVDALVILMAAYDLWSTRRIHRVTLWGGIFMIVVEQLTIPVGSTAAWHAFARWVQGWGL
ncbi:MAG: hypothetical protein WCA37_12240 [Terracidiphilus sp.]